MTYPFRSYDGRMTVRQPSTGERTWDYNTDGVANYGLYLDWLEELRDAARAGRSCATCCRGPEAYLQMWERAAGVPFPRAPEAGPRRACARRGCCAPRASPASAAHACGATPAARSSACRALAASLG